MNNIVENNLFALFKVVWIQYTGEVGKFIIFYVIFSGFHAPKIIKIGWFLTSHRCHNQRLLL